jgi:hypothetical protein
MLPKLRQMVSPQWPPDAIARSRGLGPGWHQQALAAIVRALMAGCATPPQASTLPLEGRLDGPAA